MDIFPAMSGRPDMVRQAHTLCEMAGQAYTICRAVSRLDVRHE